MFILKPKTLESQSAPAYFYAHGGGAYALTAKHQNPTMSSTAVNLNCVVFNIDYRLGPEVKAPVG
jgi:acetyl esterase/lipase